MSKPGRFRSVKENKAIGGKPRAGSKPFSKPSADRRGAQTRASSAAQRGAPSRNAAALKKFNPSDFIKKVEETVASVAYVPKHTFADFQIATRIKDNIAKKGYISPTAIQDQVIPLVLQGKDIIATSNTGTGKTAAFLIPLVNNLLNKKVHRVLIMTPTRELAAQIEAELESFMASMGYAAALCIGGASINPQIWKLKKNPEFVIGTPGRLKDLVNQQILQLGSFDAVVLDEVDTMLDMGFIHDITLLIRKMPAKRQTLFFSATISPEIRTLMQNYLSNPAEVNVKARQSAENVNQDVVKVGDKDKLELLHDLLIKPGFNKVIIFTRTKWGADKLYKKLQERGFAVVAMHGDKSQGQRTKALALFKSGKAQILLATDVVSRGIDIDDVTHVINYDLPATHEDYIHRIGRTGRADKVGQAITFID
jgi:superfamily II DNA/RNA helicase